MPTPITLARIHSTGRRTVSRNPCTIPAHPTTPEAVPRSAESTRRAKPFSACISTSENPSRPMRTATTGR